MPFANRIRRRLEPTLLRTPNAEWTQIACGVYHTAGLTKNGKVYTWGRNHNGQIGHGDKSSMPMRVLSLDGLVVTKIACGA